MLKDNSKLVVGWFSCGSFEVEGKSVQMSHIDPKQSLLSPMKVKCFSEMLQTVILSLLLH